MKKKGVILFIIFMPIIFTNACKSEIIVQPPELSIIMDDDFSFENTSNKVTITNNNNFSINVSWYLEHPNPISWIRPNRTCISNLSWFNVTPTWAIINPFDTAFFYIQLLVPEKNEVLDQHWETWITFKEEKANTSSGLFNQEYAVRMYIDTPSEFLKENTLNKSVEDFDLFPIYILVPFIICLFFIALFIKRRMKD